MKRSEATPREVYRHEKDVQSASRLLWIALGSGCLSEEAMGADYEPGTPSTCLFDTGSFSPAPLDATELASRVRLDGRAGGQRSRTSSGVTWSC